MRAWKTPVLWGAQGLRQRMDFGHDDPDGNAATAVLNWVGANTTALSHNSERGARCRGLICTLYYSLLDTYRVLVRWTRQSTVAGLGNPLGPLDSATDDI